jgi:cell division septum initiation protein DivIVA
MPDQSSAASEHAILQEITAPLETLPDDPVGVVVNADFPVALRGYDRLAVDAYVQKTSQLVAELQATRSPEAAVRRALERVGEQISGILQRAHETAEQITAQSRREAEDRLEQARGEASEIAAAAAQRVRDLDADTDRIWIERHRIVDDARDLASQLLALAQAAAERFPDDAEADASAPLADAAATEAAYQPEDEAEELAYDEPEYEDEEPITEPSPEEDVEATRAFKPFTDEEHGDSPEDATRVQPDEAETRVQPDEAETRVQPPPAPAPRPDAGSRMVIPPASQAANRRTTE